MATECCPETALYPTAVPRCSMTLLFCPIAREAAPVACAALILPPPGSTSMNLSPICTFEPSCCSLIPLPAFKVTVSPEAIFLESPSTVTSASDVVPEPLATASVQPLSNLLLTSLNCSILTASVESTPFATLVILLPPLSRPVLVNFTDETTGLSTALTVVPSAFV